MANEPHQLAELSVDTLQAAVRGLVWALDDSDSNEDTKNVENVLWMLECELLTRGIVPDKAR